MKRTMLLLPLLCLACNRTAGPQPGGKTLAPVATISAQAITAEYKKNEVAADERFKGKPVEVSGTIGEIGKNAFDQMFVSIKSEDAECMDLQAAFEDKHKADLVTLKAGQAVRVQGTVSGFVMGGVTLTDCHLVK